MKIDKNVLIIGASQGIGKALAETYSSAGADIVLLSRNVSAIEEISCRINKAGKKCFYQKCDIAAYEDVKKGIEFAQSKLDSIDLAIINAGVGNPEWMINFNSCNFKRVMGINTFGIAHALEFLIPIMKKQGYGTIAGNTSLSDVRGYPGSSSYCSSKAASSVLLESARVELKEYNIHVVTIKPGFVKTAMTDKNEFYMPFLMQTDKAAKIIMKRISKRKSIVQFPFFTVMLTRLAKFAPNFIFDKAVLLGRKIKK